MVTKYKDKIKTLSLIEAVDTLSQIADMNLDTEEKPPLLSDERRIYWLKGKDEDMDLHVVKEIFKVILTHLKATWNSQVREATPERIESIKTIMLLVGKAAKNLDRYTELFEKAREKSVIDLREYTELKRFYQSKISRAVDEGTLSIWLYNLAKGFIGGHTAPVKEDKQTLSQHIFIDLEQIKSDVSYELLFIRKEDGTRFFNPRLIRNMKLILDFGGSLEGIENDPLRRLSLAHDKVAMHSAKAILKALGSRLDLFFKEAAKHRKKMLPQILSSALMSLFLAASTENSSERFKTKTCIDYLADFIDYLHLAVTSPDYQKMAAYPPKSTNHLDIVLLDTIHAIVRAFLIHVDGVHEVAPIIDEALSVEDGEKSLSRRLENEYENFKKRVKSPLHGPMIRNLQMIENWESKFAPLLQKNLPSQFFTLYMGKKRVLCLKLPSPTVQEYIHKAHVLDEFVAFLRASGKVGNKHLMFNLQDRTSWKEIARCKALEGLGGSEEFNTAFAINTIPFETDFYHQLAPYDQDKLFSLFKEHFIEQLTDESTGFYFQKDMAKIFNEKFLGDLIDAVSKVFFHKKNTLTEKQRLDFISITYLMLYLKCIAVLEPDTLSFTCKDCLDIGISQSALLFVFFKMLHGSFTEDDNRELRRIIFSEPLLVRERGMLPERFTRMLGALSTLESTFAEDEGNFKHMALEAFGPLVGEEVLHCQLAKQ